jgi:hypothetical protein
MATRTISAAGGNYDAVGTWDEGVVPTNADDVVVRADGTSGSVTVTAAAAAKTLVLTAGAYNGTFTINSTFSLVVSGDVTLNSSGTCTGISGAGTLSQNSVSTVLTSNGKTIACNYSYLTDNRTLTLVGDVNITGTFAGPSGTTGVTLAASVTTKMTVAGGTTLPVKITLNSTVTLSVTGGTISGNVTSGAGVFGTGTFEFDGSVTIAATGPYLRCSTVRITTNGVLAGGSISFGGNVSILGALSLPTTTFRYRATGTLTLDSPASFGADFNVVGVTLTTTGAQTVTLTSTISATISPAGIVPGNCTWDTSAATVTIATAIALRFGGSFTVVSVTLTGTATLGVDPGSTLTITSLLRAVGNYAAAPHIKAQTNTSAFTLALAGATVESAYCLYTDCNVTGVVIQNAFGGSLVRSSGITNLANNEALDSADPGVANVLFNTGYTIDGSDLTGTFIGKSSYGSIS